MHYFHSDRPRWIDERPMYLSSSGRVIAPLRGLEVRPLYDPGGQNLWQIGDFWLYAPNRARFYFKELTSADELAEELKSFRADPEAYMQGLGWGWEDVRGQRADSKVKEISFEELFS